LQTSTGLLFNGERQEHEPDLTKDGHLNRRKAPSTPCRAAITCMSHTDDAMTRITVEHLIRHLARAGFVLLRLEASSAPTAAIMPHSIG